MKGQKLETLGKMLQLELSKVYMYASAAVMCEYLFPSF